MWQIKLGWIYISWIPPTQIYWGFYQLTQAKSCNRMDIREPESQLVDQISHTMHWSIWFQEAPSDYVFMYWSTASVMDYLVCGIFSPEMQTASTFSSVQCGTTPFCPEGWKYPFLMFPLTKTFPRPFLFSVCVVWMLSGLVEQSQLVCSDTGLH